MPSHIEVVEFLKPARAVALGEICRRYGVRRLSVFGSSLDGTRQPQSDLDLLAEFEPGKTPGFAFMRLAEEFTQLFEIQVDLHTPGSLSKYFRDSVCREAREIYASEK